MSTIDLTGILYNVSQSFYEVERMTMALGYVLGIMFVVSGLFRLTKLGRQSRETPSTPLSFILGGAFLIYLPSSMDVLTNTLFGSSNILQYQAKNIIDVYGSVKILVQASGLIWFVRGTVLMIHASAPGQQHGKKGLLFVVAGIMAVNFDFTVSTVNHIFQSLITMGLQNL